MFETFKSLQENITENRNDSHQPIGGLRRSKSFDDNFLLIRENDTKKSANITPGFSNLTSKSLTEDNRYRRPSNYPINSLFLTLHRAKSMSHLQSDLDISVRGIEYKTSTTDQMESVVEKCEYLERKSVKDPSYKIELEKSKRNEEVLNKQIKELQKFYSNLLIENEQHNKNEFTQKLHEPSSSSSNYMNVQILEKDQILKKYAELSIKTELMENAERCNKLDKKHLVEKYIKFRNIITNFLKHKIFVECSEGKIPQFHGHMTTLQGEVEHIKHILQNKEEENVYLSNENMKLERVVANMNGKLRLLEEKYETIDMNCIENKLLLLKLQKLEEEKNNMLREFDMERKIFNNILKNDNELEIKERYVELLKVELKDCSNKVIELKKYLGAEKEHNVKLDNKKLQLEREMNDVMRKIRIFEKNDECKFMDKTECRIFKMKLEKLEKQNIDFTLEFEQEREVYERDLHDLRQEMNIPEKKQDFTDKDHLLLDIQKLNTEKEKEIVYLLSENAKIKQADIELFRKLELLQGKCKAVDMCNNECRLLELKLKKEKENNDRLREEFEIERNILSNLLKNNKEIHEKNKFIEKLEHKLCELHIEKKDLRNSLKTEKQKNVQLEHKRTALEHEILKIGEYNNILEEKDRLLHMDRTECKLIKMKLQKSELENKNLQAMFEQERIVFDKVCKEKSVQEKEIKCLLNILRTELNHEIESMIY